MCLLTCTKAGVSTGIAVLVHSGDLSRNVPSKKFPITTDKVWPSPVMSKEYANLKQKQPLRSCRVNNIACSPSDAGSPDSA